MQLFSCEELDDGTLGFPQKMKVPPRKRTACFAWKVQSQYWLEAVSNMKPYSWVDAAIEGGIVYGIRETNHSEVGWEFIDQGNSPGRRHFRTPSKSEHREQADGDTQCNDRRIVVLQLQLVARISSNCSHVFREMMIRSPLAAWNIYLWSKGVCLVTLRSPKPSMALHSAVLVSLEGARWVGVQPFGLRLFGVTVWKLLIIEPFFQWN